MRRIAIKNHLHEIQLITRRCITMLVIMLVLIALLIARLAYLQLAHHTLYTTLSQKNWLDLIPLEPTRGLIFDRNGVLLAENIPVFSLDVLPYKIKNFPKLLADITKIVPLTDNDIAQFQRQLKQHRRFDEITLKLRLSEEEVARFAEYQYRFPGVFVKARLIRHYPFNGSFSHVLGYVGRVNTDELREIDPINYSATNYIGKLGIERFYEEELHGKVGYQQAENNAGGEAVRVLNSIKPVPGKNLYLSIDSQLQFAAEKAFGEQRGALVAIDPNTGEILALISTPTFDPNMFVEGISNKNYKALQESPDHPLYNRALRGLYPFASTIKPFIALEGLDSGVASTDFTLFDLGWYKLPNSSHVFHDWNWRQHGHGRVNLNKAIISSCDTYFYDLAHKLGIRRIDNMLEKFGFGDFTGIDMDEELAGVVSSPQWKRKTKGLPWYEGDTIISGIGQGYMQTTPLQLATGTATLANRGVRYIPHLLHAEQYPDRPLILQPPQTAPPVMLHDNHIWDIVINAMQGVLMAPGGTGYHFGKPTAYTAAAKTGTAQVYSKKYANGVEIRDTQKNLPENLRDHSWFIVFAPIDKPKIALAVIAENSSLAANIARQVVDNYLIGPPPLPSITPAINTTGTEDHAIQPHD